MQTPDESLKGARIFVVEDEVLIAMEIQGILEDSGAVVVGPCHSLAEALVMARSVACSAAVLDIRLGREAVTPVARILEQRSIPFLFYSGQPAADPVRVQWPGVVTVPKPASPSQILQAVGQLLHIGTMAEH